MPKTESQARAAARYEARSAKQLNVRFYPSEHELYDWVREQDNANGYIKQLIRQDMERAR